MRYCSEEQANAILITFLYLNLKEKHRKKRNTCLMATVHGRHGKTDQFLFPYQNSCKLLFNASSISAKWENGGKKSYCYNVSIKLYADNSSSQWLLILTWWQMQWHNVQLDKFNMWLHPNPAPYMCSWDPHKIPSIINITLRRSSIKMKHTHNDNTLHACKAGKINIWLMHEQWTLNSTEIQCRLHTVQKQHIFSTRKIKTHDHHDDPPISNSFDFMASSALKANASFMSWSNVSKGEIKIGHVFHVTVLRSNEHCKYKMTYFSK